MDVEKNSFYQDVQSWFVPHVTFLVQKLLGEKWKNIVEFIVHVLVRRIVGLRRLMIGQLINSLTFFVRLTE